MKKQTLLSFLCAGTLMVAAVTGLTGFADGENTSSEAGGYTLLSTAEVDAAEVKKFKRRISGYCKRSDAGSCINYEQIRAGGTGSVQHVRHVWFWKWQDLHV